MKEKTATIIAAIIGAVATLAAALIAPLVAAPAKYDEGYNDGLKKGQSNAVAAAGKQSIAVQTLRFNGSNLELAPAIPYSTQNMRDESDEKAEFVDAVLEALVMEEVWVRIWEEGTLNPKYANAKINVRANYAPNGNASYSLESLPPGQYFCMFFGTNKGSIVYTWLYDNPTQLFRWDGTKGEFLS